MDLRASSPTFSRYLTYAKLPGLQHEVSHLAPQSTVCRHLWYMQCQPMLSGKAAEHGSRDADSSCGRLQLHKTPGTMAHLHLSHARCYASLTQRRAGRAGTEVFTEQGREDQREDIVLVAPVPKVESPRWAGSLVTPEGVRAQLQQQACSTRPVSEYPPMAECPGCAV